MDITIWGHACARLDRDGQALVVDPGSFSDLGVLTAADTVLVTHAHADHLDAATLAGVLTYAPHRRVWGPPEVVAALVEAGAPADRCQVAAPGDRFTSGGFDIQVLAAAHALIHPDVPRPQNVAYLVDGTVLHPGDSFTLPPAGTDLQVLFVPAAGPWMRIADAIDYLRAAQPRLAVPVHDAILSDAGRALADRLLIAHGGAEEYRRLAPGERLVRPPLGV